MKSVCKAAPKVLLLSNRAEKHASPMQAKVEVRPVSVSGLTYMQSCQIFQATSPEPAHSGAASVSFQKADGFSVVAAADQQKGGGFGE